MTVTSPDLLEQIRQQFDAAPYPNIPLEESPRNSYASLYTHNLITPYYFRNQKIISTQGKLILDVGCGSGYTSLVLAEANPGAKIVGIDISGKSIDLARQRLAHYGFDQAEFYTMGVEELSALDMQFDYINCDEVLYLLPDPNAGLRSMRDVLALEGIIRVNFHSSLQRQVYMQLQKFADLMGLLNADNQDESIFLLRKAMGNLNSNVWAKKTGWHSGLETDDQEILTNHLLRGDKSWTIPEFFSALQQNGLDFIRMVQWTTWEIADLFSDLNELPQQIKAKLTDASQEERLHIFELLHPSNHRLLDLWCGHSNQTVELTPHRKWTESDWENSLISLHPQLLNDEFREDLIDCVKQRKPLDFNDHIIRRRSDPIVIDNITTACLISLFDSPKKLNILSQQWLSLCPYDLVTLEVNRESDVKTSLQRCLEMLESLGYILIEK
jgi:ubiquinone/menaquinone biosynthesis C-methylase UbiE